MKFFAIAALAALAHAQTDPVPVDLDLSIGYDEIVEDSYNLSNNAKKVITAESTTISGTWEIALNEDDEKCLKLTLSLDWDVEW